MILCIITINTNLLAVRGRLPTLHAKPGVVYVELFLAQGTDKTTRGGRSID
jgi:hypothetical protein